MTAAAPASPLVRRRRGMKLLAGGLAVVCAALFLLAVEQRHAVAAWRAVEGAFSGELSGSAASPERRPIDVLTASEEDRVLSGAFQPRDALTHQAVGEVVFSAGLIRFGSGETLHTRPLRIARGGEAFSRGRTYADLWGASPEAQVELRSVLSPREASSLTEPSLCHPDRPGAAALLHRRDRLDLMVFRQGAAPGPETPESAICGAWSFWR